MRARLAELRAHEEATEANVDDLKDVLPGGGGGGEASLTVERREEAVGLLVRLAIEQRERVAKDLRPEGSGHAHAERVDVRDHDDGALVGDVLAKAELRERAPVVVLERGRRVREP